LAEQSAPQEQAATLTVLVADDDPDCRIIHSRMVTEMGYGVLMASNGIEAVELARRVKPHAILMDLSMPHLGGRRAVMAIRSDPDTRDIPVIAISGGVAPQDIETLRAMGFFEVLHKPVRMEAIVNALRRVGAARS
jgi:CheY-like chemotaxis protein